MNDEIIIQAMEESDVDQVLKLWNEVFDSSFLESSVTKDELQKYSQRNPDFSSVACTINGTIIGALLCGHDGIRGFIYHIAIYNEYRVREIGKMMIDRSLSKLKDVGIKTGFIFTQNNNYDMDETFNSVGWVVIPTRYV